MVNNSYYNIKKLLEKKAVYNIIIGQRGNGKTYQVLKYGLEQYLETRNKTIESEDGQILPDYSQMAIIRRYADNFKGKRAQTMFDNLVSTGVVDKLTDGLFENIIYKSGCWYLASKDENDKWILDEHPFCYSFALTQVESDKSSSYPHIKTVLFDEFISRNGYLPDEFSLFQNTLSTIIRDKKDVTVFMCGNTVNKYGCIYFSEMKLTHIKQQKIGTIDVYRTDRKLPSNFKTLIAVEYCDIAKATSKSAFYFDWDSKTVQMITKGYWELALYAVLPFKYSDLYGHMLHRFFIVYHDEMLTAELYNYKNSLFIYIQRKTSELHIENDKICFSLDVHPEINFFTKILHPERNIPLLKIIAQCFINNKVFYQNDEIGEICRSYIIESEQKMI